jgi:CBS domain-containing protein
VKVKELMSTEVVTVGPETSLKAVAKTLTDHRISGVPVVGEGRNVLGVVSEADILFKEKGADERTGGFFGWLLLEGVEAEAKLAARTAGEAMTSPPITIGPEREVYEAASRMTELGVNRLPVVDEQGKLLGIVTRTDLVRAFTRSDAEIAREVREDVLLGLFALAPEHFELRVAHGEVTIRGYVETKADAEAIPRFVERIPGVVSVKAELTWGETERRRSWNLSERGTWADTPR